jgi:hypothetical protein
MSRVILPLCLLLMNSSTHAMRLMMVMNQATKASASITATGGGLGQRPGARRGGLVHQGGASFGGRACSRCSS